MGQSLTLTCETTCSLLLCWGNKKAFVPGYSCIPPCTELKLMRGGVFLGWSAQSSTPKTPLRMSFNPLHGGHISFFRQSQSHLVCPQAMTFKMKNFLCFHLYKKLLLGQETTSQSIFAPKANSTVAESVIHVHNRERPNPRHMNRKRIN